MNNLVFLQPKSEPFTTSNIIAEYSQTKHHSMTKLIQTHEKDLAEFGKVRFEIEPLPHSKTGQTEKIYHLNEQQATLIITYLKNTEPVRAFKKELVRQFFVMREELFRRKDYRAELIQPNKDLADVIKAIPPHEHSRFDYPKYNNLAYILAFGMSGTKIKRQRGAYKAALPCDYLTATELKQLDNIKQKIITCIEIGLSYNEIKDKLSRLPLGTHKKAV